jgi:hypothetical protein
MAPDVCENMVTQAIQMMVESCKRAVNLKLDGDPDYQ